MLQQLDERRIDHPVPWELVALPIVKPRSAELMQADRDIEVRRSRYRSARIELLNEPARFGRNSPPRRLTRGSFGQGVPERGNVKAQSSSILSPVRCSEMHPVFCDARLRAPDVQALLLRWQNHGAHAHGFTPAWYTQERITEMEATLTCRRAG